MNPSLSSNPRHFYVRHLKSWIGQFLDEPFLGIAI
jgi:hypothetical protein